jgi:hypothetical protein
MTYASPAWEFAADSHLMKLQRLAIFQGAHWFGICIWRSKFHMYMTTKQNYAGSKQKSYNIMIIKMFATLDKAKLDIESIRGLNLAAVKHMTVPVTRLPF